MVFGAYIPDDVRRVFGGVNCIDLTVSECLRLLDEARRGLAANDKAIRARRELLVNQLAHYRNAFAEYDAKLQTRTLMEMNYPIERAASVFGMRAMLESFAEDHARVSAELDEEAAVIHAADRNIVVLVAAARVIVGLAEPTQEIADAVALDIENMVPWHIHEARRQAKLRADELAAGLAAKKAADEDAWRAREAATDAEEEEREEERLAYARTIPDSDVHSLLYRLFPNGGYLDGATGWTGENGARNLGLSLIHLRKLRDKNPSPSQEYVRGRLLDIVFAQLSALGDIPGWWPDAREAFQAEKAERQARQAA